MNILVTINSYQALDGPWHSRLKQLGWNIETKCGPLSESQILKGKNNYDGIICGEDILNQATIKHLLPRLKTISKSGVGYDTIDIDLANANGVSVSFTKNVNTQSVAEHFLGLTLASLRSFKQHFCQTSLGQWNRTFGHELFGKKLGLIGMGAVGQKVAEIMKCLGAEVLAYDPHCPNMPKEVLQVSNLEELFRESDIIGITCALNNETHNLINTQTLRLCKPHALIVNTSRGNIVNSNDIALALKTGTIGAYATDTLEMEPPAENHPLLSSPNTIITPHVASKNYETATRQVNMAVENLINNLCTTINT